KPRDIQADQVQPVVEPVMVRIVFERGRVPRFELPAQHQVEFQMHMRPRLVQSFAGMSHHAEPLALLDTLSWPDRDRAEMAVKTVVFTAVEPMLDHDVTA